MTGLRDEWVEAVERENDGLRERVRQLEELLGFTFESPPQFGLSRQESIIFGLLMKLPLVRKEMAITALYLHKQDEAEAKIVDVFICKIRKKLKAWDIKVSTQWGQGYFLSAEAKAMVCRVQQGGEVAA